MILLLKVFSRWLKLYINFQLHKISYYHRIFRSVCESWVSCSH